MIAVSVKFPAAKIVLFICALCIIGAVAILWPQGGTNAKTAYVGVLSGVPAAKDASTNAGRIKYLRSFGWKVIENPVEVVELTIPQTFDVVYNRYNALQKKQGFDLERYRGSRVKRYTYQITNYQGQPLARANLLVLNGTVIGGDVSTTAINGFMHGLSIPSQSTTGIDASSADISADAFTIVKS